MDKYVYTNHPYGKNFDTKKTEIDKNMYGLNFFSIGKNFLLPLH